jgi:hypothetical protein
MRMAIQILKHQYSSHHNTRSIQWGRHFKAASGTTESGAQDLQIALGRTSTPILNKKPTTNRGTGIKISEEILNLKASKNRHPPKQGLPEEHEWLYIF